MICDCFWNDEIDDEWRRVTETGRHDLGKPSKESVSKSRDWGRSFSILSEALNFCNLEYSFPISPQEPTHNGFSLTGFVDAV